MSIRIIAERQIFDCMREGIFACPISEDSELQWLGLIIGPENSIEFTKEYPRQQFTIKVLNPEDVFHPNFYTNGKICLDLIQREWKRTFTLESILISIRSLLTDPNPASPANHQAAELFVNDRRQYNQKVRVGVLQSQQRELPEQIKKYLNQNEQIDDDSQYE